MEKEWRERERERERALYKMCRKRRLRRESNLNAE